MFNLIKLRQGKTSSRTSQTIHVHLRAKQSQPAILSLIGHRNGAKIQLGIAKTANKPIWKAQVKGFEFHASGKLTSRVRVCCAYEPCHILVDPNMSEPRMPCNCKSLMSLIFPFKLVVCTLPHCAFSTVNL